MCDCKIPLKVKHIAEALTAKKKINFSVEPFITWDLTEIPFDANNPTYYFGNLIFDNNDGNHKLKINLENSQVDYNNEVAINDVLFTFLTVLQGGTERYYSAIFNGYKISPIK